jgi:hypothetical protein
MTPERCLLKIIEDCRRIDTDLLDLLPDDRADQEKEAIVERWLRWISSVNRPDWESDDDPA